LLANDSLARLTAPNDGPDLNSRLIILPSVAADKLQVLAVDISAGHSNPASKRYLVLLTSCHPRPSPSKVIPNPRGFGGVRDLLFGGMAVASAALIGGIIWLTTLRPMRRDLQSPTYFRTTGPIQLVYIRNGHMLRLAD